MTQANAAQLKAELDAGEEILRTATLARLAYDGVDGTPRVIPIGFLWTGQAVVVATHPTAPKFAALRARPRVALGWCQLLNVGAIAWSAQMLLTSLPYWPINASISSSIW